MTDQSGTQTARQPLAAARRMVAVAWAADRRLASVTVALLTAQAAFAALVSLWLRVVTDGADAGHGRAVLLGGLGIAVSVTITVGVEYAGNRARMTLGDRTQFLLNRRLLELVALAPTLDVHTDPAWLRELELFQLESWEFSQVIPAIVEALSTAVRVAITVVLLASVSPLLLTLPLFAVPMLVLSRRTSDLFNRGNELAAEPDRRAEMLYQLAASATAAAELRLFRLQEELLRRFEDEKRQSERLRTGLVARAQGVRLAGRMVFLAGYLGAIGLTAELAARGQLSLGAVAMAAVLSGQVLTLITGSAEHASWLRRTLRTAARYLFLEQAATCRPGRAPARSADVPAALTSGITLDRVSFTHPGRTQRTLRDISVTLPAGATVAIVGDNGAGKTTLVSLLCGLLRPEPGRILADGADLAGLDPQAWRERISAGFQDHARFELTVQHAVGLGRLADLDDPAAAVRALGQAGANRLPARLPDGLATQLGISWPGGVDLSGGQWQQLAIARAMMRPEPLLLVLDEPTAAIDAQTEHDLFVQWTRAARRNRRRAGAITVLVSHRFGTVRMADLILVLRDGRLAEAGSHAALMAAGGLYAELFELQARAYR